VNTFPKSPAKLKEIMVKEKINWRTFADQGEISERWNTPMTPTFYVLDSQGVIQRKWVGSPGAKSIDGAIDKLIKQLEKAAP
jgi:hypothetical protein